MEIDDIISLVQSDPGLSPQQKEEITKDEHKKKLSALLSGASGGTLMLALAKYKKMSRTAQAIMTGLGFGAGLLVYKFYTRNKFATYNDTAKTYEIDTKKF
jgi:hypothetical protein